MSTSLRERIQRGAKDRAVENLTAIHSPVKQSPAAKKTSKVNRSSYKAFGEQTNLSDDDQSDPEETPTKKVTKTRQRKPTTGAKDKTMKSRGHLTFNKNASNVDTIATLDSDNSLFSQILSGQVSLQTIVDDWIESYKKNKDKAMLDLIQFLVRSSGCKAAYLINNKEILKSKEFTETINELIENFNDDENNTNASTLPGVAADTYPFIQTSFQAKRFKSNFCEFILLLVNQCQYSIIYDQFMTDILITFLIALADSQVRAFRHTATLAVLKIMTGLVDILLALSVAKDACQRQYENERQKSTAKRAQDRLEMLSNKKKEIEENEYEIQNFINFIFKAVAIHRYRDICDAIRCVCINEIGEWMKRYPNKFLDDTFLKYIGWTLHDKVAECRLKCLQALQPLYEDEDLLPRLELFTSRFKNRIIEMSLDANYEVSVAAIKLLTSIITYNDSALEDKDCENLYELVYHTNRQVAQAAGEFLNQKLFIKVENPPVEFKRGKKQSENSTFIQLLVQFLIESELHDHPAYLIDAMWDIHPMLKDWECMTDLLLEDPLNPEDVMDDTHERYLVEIITCCVRQAATGEYPIARRPTANRKLTIKETKQAADDKLLLTQHFITTLPLLLTKYIADQEKLVYLLQIPTYFDLAQYTARRQEKSLDSLLKIIQEIINKHNDSEVLEEGSRCLSYLCDEDQSIYTRCNLARSTILDDLVSTFNKAMDKMNDQNEVDESEFFPLVIALRRLSAFAENHSIVNYDIVGHTLTILKWAIFNEDMGADLACKALNLARSILTWHLQKLNTEMEERANLPGDEAPEINHELIDIISKLTKKFYKICNKLFVHDNPQIEEEAYFEICDILVLFNVHLANVHKEYKPLILECSTNDINMLSVYVMNNVFTENAVTERPDSSERIERLHKRRCVLSSFCKLICYNCVPIKYAAEILRGYIKYAGSYGDIIKHLLSSCREISKVNTAKTMVLALQREYNEIAMVLNQDKTMSDDTINQTRIDRNSPESIALRELARRFCLSFGPDASTKSREAIVAIHQEAIRYVNESGGQTGSRAPHNLGFLEVITEFSARLIPQDKKLIQAELDKYFARRANKIDANNWLPYYSYRISLMDDPNSAQNSQQPEHNGTLNHTKANSTLVNQIDASLMPAPLNTTDLTSTRNYQRKRKNNHAIDVSGVSLLKDTSRLNTQKNLLEDDLDEENENVDKETNEYNTHAESTTNDLESLKLSTINPNESTRGGRNTRSSKTFAQPKIITNNKRSRSPLTTNNSINESSDQGNILSSTRIEPKVMKLNKKAVTSAAGKNSIATRALEYMNNKHFEADSSDDEAQQNNDLSEIEQDSTAIEFPPSSKRNRRSEENENELSVP